jgi:hypothetical protein
MGTLREVSKLYAQGQAISTPEPPSVPDQN